MISKKLGGVNTSLAFLRVNYPSSNPFNNFPFGKIINKPSNWNLYIYKCFIDKTLYLL